MNPFFRSIQTTNAAYCASLGLPSDAYGTPLSDAELNGTPLSPMEEEVANKFSAMGINDKAASMFAAMNQMPAPKPLTWNPRTMPPAFHAVIEYAARRSMWDQKRIEPALPDMDINAHMGGFGFRSGDRNWTGD